MVSPLTSEPPYSQGAKIRGPFDWRLLDKCIAVAADELPTPDVAGLYLRLSVTDMQTTVAEGYGGYGIVDIIRPDIKHEPILAAGLLVSATHNVDFISANWRAHIWPRGLRRHFRQGKPGVWQLHCQAGTITRAQHYIASLESALEKEFPNVAAIIDWELREGFPKKVWRDTRFYQSLSRPWVVQICGGLLVACLLAMLARFARLL